MATRIQQEVVSKTQSAALIKNLLRMSISSIAYQRDLFPAKCFSKEKHDSKLGFVNILKAAVPAGEDDEGNEQMQVLNNDAYLLTQWLEQGVFPCIDAGFLAVMKMCLFAPHPITRTDVLLETYEFRVAYAGANGSDAPSINSVPITKKTIKAQASRFIRSLIEFASTLDKLPTEKWITIQLEFNDACPADYQPPYFTDTNQEITHDGTARYMKIKLGSVCTDSHSLGVRFVGLEEMNEQSLKAMTPLSAASRAQLSAQQHLLCATPNSAFVATSAKHTPLDSARQPHLDTAPNPYVLGKSLEQLMLSSHVAQSGVVQAQSTPVDDNLPQSDTTTQSTLLVYLSNRNESSVKDMSIDCEINENDVKTACEQLAAKGLIKARGRTRFSLCEENSKSSSSSSSSSSSMAHFTTSAPAAPSAPKKAPRDAKRQNKQQQQQHDEGNEEDMQVTETIEDFESEKEKKMPIVSSRPKLILQKPETAARSRDAVGSHAEQKRQRDDEAGPAGSQNSADGQQQNHKKKRSIIKEPIHLTSHGQHKDDDDGTDESITME